MLPEERVEHLVRQGRGARGLRWVVVLFGLYNTIVHAVEGRGWLALGWAALTAALLAVQLAPRRLGTAVEGAGVRIGSGSRWGRLITWDEVERLRVQGPYDRWGSLVLRDGQRVLLLRGMAPEAVRELAAARTLPLEDPTRRRTAQGPDGRGAEAQDADEEARPGGAAAGRGAGAHQPQPPGVEDAPHDVADDGPLDGPFRAARRSG
ncbi:hypothetical protein [Quadrisphaera sp. KR29]|uniref:hypothetical protein n=1 Tax=Quadrisphaera sp. KR29 TaxID=3461391 RepID=UPI00404500F0